jgi:hypothetical protein
VGRWPDEWEDTAGTEDADAADDMEDVDDAKE